MNISPVESTETSQGLKHTFHTSSTASSTTSGAVQTYLPIFNDLIKFAKLIIKLEAHADDSNTENEVNSLLLDNLNKASATYSRPQGSISHWACTRLSPIIQLSMILFAYVAFPSMSIVGAFSTSIAQILRMHLHADLVGRNEQQAWPCEILCWVLITGASAARAITDRTWFIARIADFAATQQIQQFTDLVQLLSKVLWLEEEFGCTCREVWKNVLNLKGH